MAFITRVRVRGYRAIGDEIELAGLGPRVALYGDNAVGKSAVLGALRLLGLLGATASHALLGPGKPWPPGDFFEAHGEDARMFHIGTDRVEIAAEWSDGVVGGVEIVGTGAGIEVRYRAETDGIDRVAALRAGVKDLQSPVVFSGEDAQQRVYEAQREWEAVVGGVERILARPIALLPPPGLPVPDAVRAAFVDARSSISAKQRAAARRLMAGVGAVFPALGPGELDVLIAGGPHPKDLAWVRSDGEPIALDRLGGGVQSVVGTLARVLLAEASVVCVEEPEALVGERAFAGLGAALKLAVDLGVCEQLFFATHAVSLAEEGVTLVLMEPGERGPTAKIVTRPDLQRLTPEARPPRGETLG